MQRVAAASLAKAAWQPHHNLRGCFVGSGSEGLQQPEVCATIIDLTSKSPPDITVLYIGTATYDLAVPKHNQTVRLSEAGCKISELACSASVPQNMNSLVEEADVVVISGGNTLFATDRWHRIGLVPLLRDAMQRGTVLTGGSAGAICWFDAGHSDSWDPDSYKQTMAKAFEPAEGEDQPTDEASVAPGGDEKAKPWSYIRCPCLGFLPGLVCPHHDKVQSNGVLRAADFDGMLKRHPGERGICIDHFAALVVKGDSFSVLSLEGRPGSVLQGGAYSEDQAGVPGVWQKDVAVDGTIDVQLVPPEGKLVDLLKLADSIVEDPNVLTCRAENPDPE